MHMSNYALKIENVKRKLIMIISNIIQIFIHSF